jgi:alkylation response protein AidB-like acyl-CoA dehydrogenase
VNFDLTIEQKLLKDSARDFFAKEIDKDYVREMAKDEKGFAKEIWRKMANLGWMGLLIPDTYGQLEMSFIDMAILLQEMGYSCFPGPFFSTAVLGVITITEGGSDGQKKIILPKVASGDHLLTLAWTEREGGYTGKGVSLSAIPDNGHYLLSGTKIFVPDAHVADTILCVVRTGDSGGGNNGLSILALDKESKGITINLLENFTGVKLCEIIFDRVKVPVKGLIGGVDQGWNVLRTVLAKAGVAKCAEMIGGAEKVLEMTVDHAKKRVQFGRPVGSFQAIQHHCADMLTFLETSKFMTYQTCWRITKGLPFEKEASMSKAWVSDSYKRLVELGHQVMGGLGFMEEIDLNLYFSRAKAAELAFGDADFHRELVAQALKM